MQLINNATIRLGELINKLKSLPQSDSIAFDFGGFIPGRFESWRGNHSDLTITYEVLKNHNRVLVGGLLANALDCDNKTFLGWKGGNYKMDLDTPVWVDMRGECSYTGIIDIFEEYPNSGNCIIVTSHCNL